MSDSQSNLEAKRARLAEQLRRAAAVLPPSGAQQAFWTPGRPAPGHCAYVITAAIRLTGPLDADALAQAMRDLALRHPVLTARFTAAGWEPGALADRLQIERIDLGRLAPQAREAEVARLAAGLAAEPFDLAVEPPLRVSLLRCGPDEHVLLRAVHHLVWDNWSTVVFYRELSALYRARAAGTIPPPVPEPAAACPAVAEPASAERYWRRTLAGPAVPLLRAGTAEPGPGAWLRFRLPPAVAAALPEMARRHGVTPFMVLLAGFVATLAQGRAGRFDLCSMFANRGAPTADAIGLYATPAVLRIDLSDSPSFAVLLERVRDAVTGAQDRLYVPFGTIASLLAERPGVSFVFETAHPMRARLRLTEEVAASHEAVHGGGAAFPLAVMLWNEDGPGGGLSGIAEYRTDLFDEPAVGGLIEAFRTACAEHIRTL